MVLEATAAHDLPAPLCAGLDPPALMHYWFQLAQQKNALLHYESKLMIL